MTPRQFIDLVGDIVNQINSENQNLVLQGLIADKLFDDARLFCDPETAQEIALALKPEINAVFSSDELDELATNVVECLVKVGEVYEQQGFAKFRAMKIMAEKFELKFNA